MSLFLPQSACCPRRKRSKAGWRGNELPHRAKTVSEQTFTRKGFDRCRGDDAQVRSTGDAEDFARAAASTASALAPAASTGQSMRPRSRPSCWCSTSTVASETSPRRGSIRLLENRAGCREPKAGEGHAAAARRSRRRRRARPGRAATASRMTQRPAARAAARPARACAA